MTVVPVVGSMCVIWKPFTQLVVTAAEQTFWTIRFMTRRWWAVIERWPHRLERHERADPVIGGAEREGGVIAPGC